MVRGAVKISQKTLLSSNGHAHHLDLVKDAAFDVVHLGQGWPSTELPADTYAPMLPSRGPHFE